MSIKFSSRLIFAAVSFCFASVAFSSEDGAKALFYGSTNEGIEVPSNQLPSGAGKKEKSKPATVAKNAPTPKGLKLWVELVDATGGKKNVNYTTTVFRAGDKVALKVQPSKDGYLYVGNLGSTGKMKLLYPVKGQENMVKKNQTYTIPGSGAFHFDNNPGKEQLYFVLSSTKIDKLNQGGQVVAVNEGAAAPSPQANESAQPEKMKTADSGEAYSAGKTDEWSTMVASAEGSKDLLAEEDVAQNPQVVPASYRVQNPSVPDSKPFTTKIVLKHE